MGESSWWWEGTPRERLPLSDLTDPDALRVAQKRLKALGVDGALRRAGAKAGDEVRIGDLSFTYADDEVLWESR